MKSATLQLNKFQQAQNRHIVTIEHHYNTLWRDWGWKRQMSSRGIRTRDLAIHDDRRFWPRFSGILGALVKWLSSRTYAQVPLLEEVSFFMVWFDPDLPVLHIHLNNTGPTARLTARCYRARSGPVLFGWVKARDDGWVTPNHGKAASSRLSCYSTTQLLYQGTGKPE